MGHLKLQQMAPACPRDLAAEWAGAAVTNGYVRSSARGRFSLICNLFLEL